MGNNKRKIGYVSRSANLAGLKSINVLNGVDVVKCSNSPNERHFRYKLIVKDEKQMLESYVLPNDICVLIFPECGVDICLQNIVFANIGEISGKKKKGAKLVKAGDVIFSSTIDDQTIKFYCPVGGQLLETNNNIISCPQMILNDRLGAGHIAVIYPNTQLPTLEKSMSELLASLEAKKTNVQVCFAWLKNECIRGSKCKFQHCNVVDEANCLICDTTTCENELDDVAAPNDEDC